MKHLSSYKQFDTNFTLSYIEGKITESEYFNYLNSVALNEGLISNVKEFFSWLKEKILDSLWTIAEQSIKIGFSIFNKVDKICRWILEKVKSFKQKYPMLYKVVIITILVILLIIISGSIAYSQTKGDPIPKQLIDLSIGLLNDVNIEYSSIDKNKAIAYLIDLKAKNGVADPNAVQNFGEISVNLAKKSIKLANDLAERARDGDGPSYRYCIKLMEQGEKFIQFKIIKTSSGEIVQLGLKK